jgi:ribosomal protein L37AE/L43A
VNLDDHTNTQCDNCQNEGTKRVIVGVTILDVCNKCSEELIELLKR